MGDIVHLTKDLSATGLVLQINGQQGRTVESARNATRDSDDVNRARQAIEAVLPELLVNGGQVQVRPPYRDILSLHLALIHALADFNQIESNAEYHRKALLLLDYVYSDAYFDGRYILSAKRRCCAR